MGLPDVLATLTHTSSRAAFADLSPSRRSLQDIMPPERTRPWRRATGTATGSSRYRGQRDNLLALGTCKNIWRKDQRSTRLTGELAYDDFHLMVRRCDLHGGSGSNFN